MNDKKDIDEVLEVIARVLIRCVVLIIIALLFWWGALVLWGDFVYNTHSKIVPLSREQFNAIHYTGMLVTKTVAGVFFFIPYIAIRLVLRKR
jgi:hypothetical protein